MSDAAAEPSHRSCREGPEEFEPDSLPVEPDEGPVPDLPPDEPGQLQMASVEQGLRKA